MVPAPTFYDKPDNQKTKEEVCFYLTPISEVSMADRRLSNTARFATRRIGVKKCSSAMAATVVSVLQ